MPNPEKTKVLNTDELAVVIQLMSRSVITVIFGKIESDVPRNYSKKLYGGKSKIIRRQKQRYTKEELIQTLAKGKKHPLGAGYFYKNVNGEVHAYRVF